MKEDLILFKTMPWKHRCMLLSLSTLCFVLCWFAFDSLVLFVKGFLFSIILLGASYFDIRTRTLPNWIHVLILLVGLIDFNFTKSVSGIVLAPLPFLIMALIEEGSIGGGDIKLIGSSGFVLAYKNTVATSIIATIVAICFYILYYLSYNKVKSMAFPFAPFFQVGYMIVIIFGVA